MSTRLLLLGGSSEIALAIAKRLARDGELRAVLVGRDQQRLAAAEAELRQAGCTEASNELLDAGDIDRHEDVIREAFERLGGFDVVVLAVGVLAERDGLDAQTADALELMRVNFYASGSLMLHCLRRLRTQGSGTLVVLSSVAAERPRASLAFYSAAKAGLDGLAQALGDDVRGTGARVLVVRPGFVTTKMTARAKRPPYAIGPEAVAEATVRALGRPNVQTVWVPAQLRYVFSGLRHIPRRAFRRLPI